MSAREKGVDAKAEAFQVNKQGTGLFGIKKLGKRSGQFPRLSLAKRSELQQFLGVTVLKGTPNSM